MFEKSYPAGSTVRFALYDNQNAAVWLVGKVLETNPFTVELSNADAGRLARTKKALILGLNVATSNACEVVIYEAKPQKDSWHFLVKPQPWNTIERRISPRITVTGTVALRFWSEGEDNLVHAEEAGLVQNLSTGGAWVVTEAPLVVGQIVQGVFCLTSGEKFEAMSEVVQKVGNGYGFEFVMLGEGASEHLASLLSRLAA